MHYGLGGVGVGVGVGAGAVDVCRCVIPIAKNKPKDALDKKDKIRYIFSVDSYSNASPL